MCVTRVIDFVSCQHRDVVRYDCAATALRGDISCPNMDIVVKHFVEQDRECTYCHNKLQRPPEKNPTSWTVVPFGRDARAAVPIGSGDGSGKGGHRGVDEGEEQRAPACGR